MIFTSTTQGISNSPSLAEVRTLYQKAATQEEACNNLISILTPYSEKGNVVFDGYKACGTMMLANYTSNPFSKYQYFSEGKSGLEKSIELDNKNIELRYLRFTIQTNLPSFLEYNNSINEDKLFLINAMPAITDLSLKQTIISYLENSSYLTVVEKQKLK